MPTDLPKQYDPHEAQQRWLAFWDQRGYNQDHNCARRDHQPPHALASRQHFSALLPQALLLFAFRAFRHLRLRSTGEEAQPVNRRRPIVI